MSGRTRIGPKKPRRVFLPEWREKSGLTQKQLGERLDPVVTDMTISRWERAARGERGPNAAQMNDDVRAAVAEALGIEPGDLDRHPDQPSADELLRGSTPEIKAQAMRVIEALVGKRKTG